METAPLRLPARPRFQQLAAALVHDTLADAPGRILEAGCGSAPVARLLAGLPGRDVVCVDIQPPKQGVPPGASFLQLDLCQPLPFPDGAFSAVACTEVIEHLKNPFGTLEEFARVLEPGGVLVFSLPNFWNMRRRWRYFLTGNLNVSRFFDSNNREAFRANRCPHINTTTLPVYEYGLASLGLEVDGFRVGVQRRGRRVYWPLAVLVRGLNGFSERRSRRFLLPHTNHPRVLMGGDHLMLRCRKVGFDNVGYDVRPWLDLDRANA